LLLRDVEEYEKAHRKAMTISESAKQLPHRESKQGMILHSFSLYEKL